MAALDMEHRFIAGDIAALSDHLIHLKASIEHWQDDVACNLKPTKESLASALWRATTSLRALNRVEAGRVMPHSIRGNDMRVCPAPPPVNDWDIREDVLRTIARWTTRLIDGDHMSPEAARAMATSCAADLYAKSFYVCTAMGCDGRVGCHPGTTSALGTPANAQLRRERSITHDMVDPIWQWHKDHEAELA